MTDALMAADDLSSAQEFLIIQDDKPADPVQIEEALALAPNGFLAFGLAEELFRAVQDLGYAQPTAVQQTTIPLAMEGVESGDTGSRFVDLMVSSQTGSGKTAAFLLPVLHTLLNQQRQSEQKERADFDRALAEAAAKGEPPQNAASAKTQPIRAIFLWLLRGP